METKFFCSEHLTPVNATGKGCVPCQVRLAEFRARRLTKRKAARGIYAPVEESQ